MRGGPSAPVALLDVGPLPKHATNECMLCGGVRLTILRKLLLQVLLQLGIPGAEPLVGSEHVAESQIVMPLWVLYGNHMHMMGSNVRSRFFHEEVPSIHSTIASINIADAAEQWDTLRNHRHRCHGYGNIQNGFRIETGHGRASHMLDIEYEVPDMLLQDASLPREKIVPAGMVSDDLYSSSLETDHTYLFSDV